MPILKKGSTSVIRTFLVKDTSSSSDGVLTGLTFNTANLVAYYKRSGSAAVAITLVAATEGAWVSGGFIACANMPGIYELHVPDAAFVTGANDVIVSIRGAANMTTVPEKIELVAYDPQDAVRMGLTSLPNAAAGANNGLPLGDSSGRVSVGPLATDLITANSVSAAAAAKIQGSLATAQNVADSANAVIEALPTDTPTTEAIVEALLETEAMKAIYATAAGAYSFTPPTSYPGTGTLVLKDAGANTTNLTISLTYDANKQVTARTIL